MRKIIPFLLTLCLAGTASAGDKITLRFGIEPSRADSQYLAGTHMGKLLKERTNGDIDLRIFPDGSLGTGPNMINQIRSGSLDMTIGSSALYTGMVPALNVLDIPFTFHNTAHVDRVLDGKIGDEMLAELDNFEMKGLAFWENGFRSLTNSRNPARTPEDVKGLKIRVTTNPMHIEAWRLLETNPVPMSYNELFTALETGAVDAQEHPIAVTWSSKFYEVQKYLSVTHHTYTPLLLAMNKKKFESLSPEYQKILVECARDAAKFQRKYLRENEKTFVDKMEAKGLEVIREEELDMKPFRDKVGPGMVKALSAIPGGTRWQQAIADAAED